MNAFSPDYTPSAETLERIARDQRHVALSQSRTAIREKKLQSPDPLIRAQARGDIGPLGLKATPPGRLLKNSKLG